MKPNFGQVNNLVLQVLIPLHFNSPRINTYKKPGEGAPFSTPGVLQLINSRASRLWSHRNACNFNLLYALLQHFSVCPGVGARASAPSREGVRWAAKVWNM